VAQAGDTEALAKASKMMQYIVEKTVELSGSAHSTEIKKILDGTDQNTEKDNRVEELEQVLSGSLSDNGEFNETVMAVIQKQQEQISLIMQGLSGFLAGQGIQVPGGQTGPTAPETPGGTPPQAALAIA
jgi:hypothetical protein